MNPSEVTGAFRRLLGRDDGDDHATEPGPSEVAESFRHLLYQDGVSATDPNAAVVEDVSELATRYEEVRPEVDRLRAELSDDADASGRTEVSLFELFEGDERIEEWRTNHPDTVDELESIREALVREIMGETIEIDEERVDEGWFDEDAAPDAIETFVDRVRSDVRLVSEPDS